MDRVVEVALADLSERVNVERELAADPDRRAAVEAFRILHGAGYVFAREPVEHWAIAHGWAPLAAIALGALAAGVNEGWAVRLLSKGPVYPDDILESWRERAAGRPRSQSGRDRA